MPAWCPAPLRAGTRCLSVVGTRWVRSTGGSSHAVCSRAVIANLLHRLPSGYIPSAPRGAGAIGPERHAVARAVRLHWHDRDSRGAGRKGARLRADRKWGSGSLTTQCLLGTRAEAARSVALFRPFLDRTGYKWLTTT